MKVRYKGGDDAVLNRWYQIGEIVEVERSPSGGIFTDKKRKFSFLESDVEVVEDGHYNNENGSLYLFAEDQGLNAWEFDILKRVVRCRKKGQFKEDLEKTKRVIDLYLQEFNNQ